MEDPRVARLRQIQALWQQYPGRGPNGSGLTGLEKTDAQGWSDMLNEQTEGLNLERELNGQEPMDVVYGGSGSPAMRGLRKAGVR